MMRNRWRFALAAMLAVSCSQSNGATNVCTLIGCSSGLTINVPTTVTLPYTATLRVSSSQTLTVQCTTTSCAHSLFVQDYTPDFVTVTVSWQGGSATKDFQPQYNVSRPNGPNCDPECKQATVTL